MKITKLVLWLCGLIFVANCTPASEVDETNPDEQYFALPTNLPDTVESEKHKYVVDTLITGLSKPWALDFMPNGNVLITEKPGDLRIVKNGQLV